MVSDRPPLRATVSWLLLAVVVSAVVLTPFDASSPTSLLRFSSPSVHHPFGTDAIGRDIGWRLLTGTSATAVVVIGATLVSLAVTAFVMLAWIVPEPASPVTRAAGRAWMRLLLRVSDTLRALPRVLLVVAAAALLPPATSDQGAVWRLAVLLGVTGWIPLTQLLRDTLPGIRSGAHVQAAHALGVPWWRVFLKHELPALYGVIAVWTTATAAELIVLEAGLSFLGVGVPLRVASWGTVLHDVSDVFGSARWLMFGPGLVIGITVIALQWLADEWRATPSRGAAHLERIDTHRHEMREAEPQGLEALQR